MINKLKALLKRVTRRLAIIQTTIILSLAYFTVFAFTAIIIKILGKKLLPHFRPDDSTYWLPKDKIDNSMDFLKRQF